MQIKNKKQLTKFFFQSVRYCRVKEKTIRVMIGWCIFKQLSSDQGTDPGQFWVGPHIRGVRDCFFFVQQSSASSGYQDLTIFSKNLPLFKHHRRFKEKSWYSNISHLKTYTVTVFFILTINLIINLIVHKVMVLIFMQY